MGQPDGGDDEVDRDVQAEPVAASARPCKRSSTALRRLPLRLHVTTAAVSSRANYAAPARGGKRGRKSPAPPAD